MGTIYKGKRYAKILPDGSIDIVTSVLKTDKNTYYHPDDKLCAKFGYHPIIEDVDLTEEEGYKVIDEGLQVIDVDGKKIVKHEGRKLKIVDNGPNPGPGQEVKKDLWKEIDGQWVHVYKYRSVSRHITPTKFNPPEEKKEEPAPEVPVEESKPAEEHPPKEDTVTETPTEEQTVAAQPENNESEPVASDSPSEQN